jgi:hypothetical protein
MSVISPPQPYGNNFILFPSFLSGGLQQPAYKAGSVLTPLYGLGQGNRNYYAAALGGSRNKIGNQKRVFNFEKKRGNGAEYLARMADQHIQSIDAPILEILQTIANVVGIPFSSKGDGESDIDYLFSIYDYINTYYTNDTVFTPAKRRLFDSFLVYSANTNPGDEVIFTASNGINTTSFHVPFTVDNIQHGTYLISGANVGGRTLKVTAKKPSGDTVDVNGPITIFEFIRASAPAP